MITGQDSDGFRSLFSTSSFRSFTTILLQVRKRADGGGVVQREQHVGEHDRPALGSLLARSRLPRRFTDQHARIGRGNARLSIRRFVHLGDIVSRVRLERIVLRARARGSHNRSRAVARRSLCLLLSSSLFLIYISRERGVVLARLTVKDPTTYETLTDISV